MTLPKFGSVKRCVKCGEQYAGDAKHPSSEPGMDYHRPGATDCPDLLLSPRTVPVEKAGPQGVREIEHICRPCLQCGYTWPEAIWVDAEPRLPE